MIPFIIYSELNDGNLNYFILQKEFPHFLGRIVLRPIEKAVVNYPIAGYELWVTFNGTLRGNIIPNYLNVIQEIESVYEKMALWFSSEMFLGNGVVFDTFSKFKIKQ